MAVKPVADTRAPQPHDRTAPPPDAAASAARSSSPTPTAAKAPAPLQQHDPPGLTPAEKVFYKAFRAKHDGRNPTPSQIPASLLPVQTAPGKGTQVDLHR